jgi:hypothetical protein
MFVSQDLLQRLPDWSRNGLSFRIWLDLLPPISAKGQRFFEISAFSLPKNSNCDCWVVNTSMLVCQSSFGWRIGWSSFFVMRNLLVFRMCPYLMKPFLRQLASFETEKCLGCKLGRPLEQLTRVKRWWHRWQVHISRLIQPWGAKLQTWQLTGLSWFWLLTWLKYRLLHKCPHASQKVWSW